MPYDSVIARGSGPTYSATPGAHPLIPEDVQREIIKGATAPEIKEHFGLSHAAFYNRKNKLRAKGQLPALPSAQKRKGNRSRARLAAN